MTSDLTGAKFGLLTAVRFSHIAKGGHHYWQFQCACGGVVLRARSKVAARLAAGHVPSCGCITGQAIKIALTKKGWKWHPLYKTWRHILYRCLNPRSAAYKDYGARGITVCQRWVDSFENFLADMGPTHKPGLSIDRKDNDKGYGPENCRWATQQEQSLNTRRNVPFDAKAIAEKAGVSLRTVYARHEKGLPLDMPNQNLRSPL